MESSDNATKDVNTDKLLREIGGFFSQKNNPLSSYIDKFFTDIHGINDPQKLGASLEAMRENLRIFHSIPHPGEPNYLRALKLYALYGLIRPVKEIDSETIELACKYFSEDTCVARSLAFLHQFLSKKTTGRGLIVESLETDNTYFSLNFRGANLRWHDFSGLNLAGANFRGANLESASFNRANLKGANFKNANLQLATFVDANIEAANFSGSTPDCADFSGCFHDEDTQFPKDYTLQSGGSMVSDEFIRNRQQTKVIR